MAAIVIAFVGAAVIVTALAAAGFARAPDFFARLHYLSLVSLIPPVLLCIAVFFSHPSLAGGLKMLLLTIVLVASGPLMIHLLARAAHRRGGPDRT